MTHEEEMLLTAQGLQVCLAILFVEDAVGTPAAVDAETARTGPGAQHRLAFPVLTWIGLEARWHNFVQVQAHQRC